MWFEALTGFKEQSQEQVRQLLKLNGDCLVSTANGRIIKTGSLRLPTLSELQSEANSIIAGKARSSHKLSVQEIVADVTDLHRDESNAGALFQVASQFNLLEMVNPEVTPESGITQYIGDRTQGPACAMACAGGLLYRNYFVPVDRQLGQTDEKQLNTLDVFGPSLQKLINKYLPEYVSDETTSPWLMQNGYALPSEQQLLAINTVLAQLSDDEHQALTATLKIGIQQGTQVTLGDAKHCVTQAYSSAMPVGYTSHSLKLWQPLATLILNATYQATLAAAVINKQETGCNKVYLTLLGGGAFRNAREWISSAIKSALQQYQYADLSVYIVSYGQSNADIQLLINSVSKD